VILHRPVKRRHRLWRRVFILLVVIAAASAWPLAHAGTALVAARDVGAPDAIVMLASHEWERLPAAASLARMYPHAVVLLTDPQVVTQYNCYRCGERVAWLEMEGVTPNRVKLLRGPSPNTHGEALAALDYVSRNPLGRLLIVTSPYHTRRALATFRQVFRRTSVDVGIAAAEGARGQPARWWLSAYDRHYILYEWAAIVKYRLQYGVPIR
jgi:uncharacterized SAM-binding protein YcdF (DUF218 family)